MIGDVDDLVMPWSLDQNPESPNAELERFLRPGRGSRPQTTTPEQPSPLLGESETFLGSDFP